MFGCGGVYTYISTLDVFDTFKAVPKNFKDGSPKIVDYMRRWVSKPGRTVIFSRDLTWANDAGAKNALCAKAKNGELTVLVEAENAITAELKAAGAEIVSYGGLGHIPRSRFTIIGFKKDGARVAIGALIDGRHVIEDFQSGAHPLFSVTEDLVQFLINSQKAA